MVEDEQKFLDIKQALARGDSNAASKSLGEWGTSDPINTVADVRNNLAISSEWKGKNATPMYVIELQVKPGVGLREGQIGPMFDKGARVVLSGGGRQVQFLGTPPYMAPDAFVIDLSNSRKISP